MEGELISIWFGCVCFGLVEIQSVLHVCILDGTKKKTDDMSNCDAIKRLHIVHCRYQTHQLRNVSQDFCITLNCYRYGENDKIQWNLFDFVKDEDGAVGGFYPNTDFTYGEMRKVVYNEWKYKAGSDDLWHA